MFKVNNKNTRKRCEICSNLIIKTPKRRQGRRSDGFIVNFERISHFFSSVPFNDFEQLNAWSPLCSQCISVNVSLGLTLITILAKDYLIDKKEKFQCVSNPTHLLTPNSHTYPFNVQCPKIVRNTLRWDLERFWKCVWPLWEVIHQQN